MAVRSIFVPRQFSSDTEIGKLFRELRLNIDKLHGQGWDWDSYSADCEIKPQEFLEFAERDLELGDRRSLVNALTNSKRGIDAEVDRAFTYFGLPKKRGKPFPQKLETLREAGLVAPRIVRKVVAARNKLEHEYKCPKLSEVEDAVDIANLFVDAVERVPLWFPFDYSLGSRKSALNSRKESIKQRRCRVLSVELYAMDGFAFLEFFKNGDQFGEAYVRSDQLLYLRLVEVAVCIERQRDLRAVYEKLLVTVDKYQSRTIVRASRTQ